MTVPAKTPEQIKKEAMNTVALSYPTKGTIVVIVAYNEAISFIVNSRYEPVIRYFQERLECNKAWSTEVLKEIVTKWPTLPLPAKPIVPVNLPIVKLDPTKKEVVWTHDGWFTFEGRKLATVIGGKANPDDWSSFTGSSARTEDSEDTDEAVPICTAGC